MPSAFVADSIVRPDEEDLVQLSQSLERLVPLGLRVGQREIRGKFGLSEPENDEDVLEATKPTPLVVPGATGDGKSPVKTAPAEPDNEDENEDPAVARQSRADPGEAAADAAIRTLEQLAGQGEAMAADAMDTLFDTIAEAIGSSDTLEEVRSRLLEISPTLSTRGLALALRYAQVVARLSGRGELVDD